MMANENAKISLEEFLMNEIAEELLSVPSEEIDSYLVEAGFNPDDLVLMTHNAYEAALLKQKRKRFEAAKEYTRNHGSAPISNIASFDEAKKQKILAGIQARTDKISGLTLAARKQNLGAKEDLDAFLEGCFRLGILDKDGNLIE